MLLMSSGQGQRPHMKTSSLSFLDEMLILEIKDCRDLKKAVTDPCYVHKAKTSLGPETLRAGVGIQERKTRIQFSVVIGIGNGE